MHIIDQMLELQCSGRFEEAWALCQQIYQQGPEQFVDANGLQDQTIWKKLLFNRGWFLLWQGLYNEGHRTLEHGREFNAYGRRPPLSSLPMFDPAQHSILGARVLLNLEGGLGDQIISVRFAKSYLQRGARSVVVVCDSDLVDLFNRVEGVTCAIDYAQDLSTVEHDFWVPGFSAGWMIGHEFRDLPNDTYLIADLNRRVSWRQHLSSNKKKIGIRWAGSPKFVDDHLRTIPPDFLFDLDRYEELEVYSLQRDHGSVRVPAGVVDLGPELVTIEDTAAAIAELDLVVTSCTSVAHLSAALGKETWVVAPLNPYHVWATAAPNLAATPYYKSVEIFRQERLGRWQEPLQKLHRRLERKFSLPYQLLPNRDQ